MPQIIRRVKTEYNHIYNEDCLVGMQDIPDGAVDMICTDLPYDVLSDSNPNAQWDNIIPFEPLWEQYKRVIKPDGAIVLFGQGLFSARLIMSNPSMYRYSLVWDKERVTGFLNAKKQPLRTHEDIMVFYGKQPTYNPQMTKCLPHQRNHSRGRQENMATNRCYGAFGKAEDRIADDKYPRSIISFQNVVQDHDHPTQKPVDLIRWLVRTFTDEGQLVLDSCMGSGTTAVACVKEKRRFIGYETNEEYYKIALKRVKAEQAQLTLF